LVVAFILPLHTECGDKLAPGQVLYCVDRAYQVVVILIGVLIGLPLVLARPSQAGDQ
jgi:hypothetical protein